MTITERIAELQREHANAVQRINEWNETRVRIEGALFVLQQMAKESGEVAADNTAQLKRPDKPRRPRSS